MSLGNCPCQFSIRRKNECPVEKELCNAVLSLASLQVFCSEFHLLAGKVLVRPELEEFKYNGLSIRGKTAIIISVGPECSAENGDKMAIKAGDRVLLPEGAGTKVMVEEMECAIYSEKELLGIFK